MIKFHERFLFSSFDHEDLYDLNCQIEKYVLHFLPSNLKRKIKEGYYSLVVSSSLNDDNEIRTTVCIVNRRNDYLIYINDNYCQNISLSQNRRHCVWVVLHLVRRFKNRKRQSYLLEV